MFSVLSAVKLVSQQLLVEIVFTGLVCVTVWDINILLMSHPRLTNCLPWVIRQVNWMFA